MDVVALASWPCSLPTPVQVRGVTTRLASRAHRLRRPYPAPPQAWAAPGLSSARARDPAVAAVSARGRRWLEAPFECRQAGRSSPAGGWEHDRGIGGLGLPTWRSTVWLRRVGDGPVPVRGHLPVSPPTATLRTTHVPGSC